MLKDFWLEESDLTMTEYAVAGALIILAAAVAFQTLGTAISDQIGVITGYVNGG